MENGRAVLLLLYSLFWAEMLATSARYNGFPTAVLWFGQGGGHCQWRRFGASFVLLNLFPVLWLWCLYALVVPGGCGLGPIIMAATAALSVFGIIRLYHGVVASKETIDMFYTSDEQHGSDDQQRFEIQGKGKLRTCWSHIVPGLIYLGFFPVLAKGLEWVFKMLG
jgi:hypothetical protein